MLNDWSPYEPTREDPWDEAKVAHLHRRAGFAAPWGVIQRDLADGPDRAIDRLLEGESSAVDGQSASEFASFHDQTAARLATGENLVRLQGHWLYRMIFAPRPLEERMTLFWHNHFATSNAKVNNLALMQIQQATLRRLALGRFGELLKAMARDAAMLIWLDSTTNRKQHPNENYAREVMELFTLGRGNYGERDVQEAARGFSGSFVQGDRYRMVASQHDEGLKTVLGKSGNFGGDEIAEILLEQAACPRFLARKLYRQFVSEAEAPSEELIEGLAVRIREAEYEMRSVIGLILRSRCFFGAAARRSRVKSPVEYVVGTIRALEITRPTVSADALAESCARMGQSVYAPPNVAGWPGGASWINTSTSLARTNFALELLATGGTPIGGRFDPAAHAARHGFAGEIPRFYARLLIQDGETERVREAIGAALARVSDGGDRARDAVRLMLSMPEYQLA